MSAKRIGSKAKSKKKADAGNIKKRMKENVAEPIHEDFTPLVLAGKKTQIYDNLDFVMEGGPSFGQAAEKLLGQGENDAILCVIYLLAKMHAIESPKTEENKGEDRVLELANLIATKIDIKNVKQSEGNKKINKQDTNKRKQGEKFIEVFVSSAVNANSFGILDNLIETLVCAAALEKRPIRHLGVHALMLIFYTTCKLCKNKLVLADEYMQRNQRIARERADEANTQIDWMKHTLEKLKKQVVITRCTDVMLEVRVAIADAFDRIALDETLQLIIDKPIAKIIGQLIFDKNKAIKKRALKIAANILDTARSNAVMSEDQNKIREFIEEMYDERHVTRIILMGYKDVGTVAIKAIQTLAGMHKYGILDDPAIDYTCRLVLRKLPPQVSREAARFIVQVFGNGKIIGLEYELKDNATFFTYAEKKAKISIEKIASVLGHAIESIDPKLKQKSIRDAMLALEKESVSVFDIKSMCEFLMKGEKDQESESKAKAVQLDAACHMILAAATRIRELEKEEGGSEDAYQEFKKKIVDSFDGILLSNLPRLLSVYKHEKCVEYLIKASKHIKKEAVVGNGINLKQMEKIVKKTCEIFRVTTSDRVAKSALKTLQKLSSGDSIDPAFQGKISVLYEETIKQIEELLNSPDSFNKDSPLLMKFPIICASCSVTDVTLIQKVLLSLISDKIPKVNAGKEGEEASDAQQAANRNLLHIFEGLFGLYANAFNRLCNPSGEYPSVLDFETFEQLREEILALFVASLRLFEDNIRVGTRCWIYLANLLTISSNDTVKTKHNDLYYEIDHFVLTAMTDHLMNYFRIKFENEQEISRSAGKISEDDELMLEINSAIQVLILSCESVFHTELSVIYLAVFGSNQKNGLLIDSMGAFLRKLSNRCVVYNGRSLYYLYVKEAITTCFNFAFQYPDVHKEELQRSLNAEGRKLPYRVYYNLLRTKDLMRLVLSGCNFFLSNGDGQEEGESQEEVKEEVKQQADLFCNFIIGLLKESLKAATNFPLLEVVQMGITTDAFPKDKLVWMIQLYEALAQHVLKIDTTIEEDSKSILNDFKSNLYQKAAARKIKRTPFGKAILNQAGQKGSESSKDRRGRTSGSKKNLKEIEEAVSEEGSDKKEKPEDKVEEQEHKKESEREREREREREKEKERESEENEGKKKRTTRKKIDFNEE